MLETTTAAATGTTQKELYESVKSRIDKKATIVGFHMLGLPYMIHVTLLDAKIGNYAQYSESVVIYFKEKGKRKPSGCRVNSRNDGGCIIYEGWVNPDVEPFPITTERGNKQSLSSFSDQYLVTAINSLPNNTPFFNNTGVVKE